MRHLNGFLLLTMFLFLTAFGIGRYGLETKTALAGNLDSPAAPTSANSAMFTLDDVYHRLKDGTAGVKRTGAFAEPSSGPTAGGYTLNDLMTVAPSVDDANGAYPSEVLFGKTFWCLNSGRWGLKTGSMPGGIAPVSRTGQITEYMHGDDGYCKQGTAWPSPRFKDNDNGTITDNLTGLIWLKRSDFNSINGTTGKASWNDALSFCNNLANGMCELSDGSASGDWRLPNFKEFLSLLDLGYNYPALSNTTGTGQWSTGNAFLNVQLSTYWTSTTYKGDLLSAWVVDLPTGEVYYDTKTVTYWVWPVR